MTVEVVWTNGAEGDLLRLYERIGDHDMAVRTLRQPLEHALGLLTRNPGLGPKVRGTKRVRRLLVGPRMRWGVFYVEEANRLMIHALLDMREDPDVLKRRLGGL